MKKWEKEFDKKFEDKLPFGISDTEIKEIKKFIKQKIEESTNNMTPIDMTVLYDANGYELGHVENLPVIKLKK